MEADFALRLAADLGNAGLSLWTDRLDAGIQVGDDWVHALQKALNECVAVVAIVSPDYVRSNWRRRELERALILGKPNFPVLLESLDRTEWPFEIQEKQYIDFRKWRNDQVYSERLETLAKVLGAHFSDQLHAAPDAETRYLTSLIAELESHRGVLEYVEMSALAACPALPNQTAVSRRWLDPASWGARRLSPHQAAQDQLGDQVCQHEHVPGDLLEDGGLALSGRSHPLSPYAARDVLLKCSPTCASAESNDALTSRSSSIESSFPHHHFSSPI